MTSPANNEEVLAAVLVIRATGRARSPRLELSPAGKGQLDRANGHAARGPELLPLVRDLDDLVAHAAGWIISKDALLSPEMLAMLILVRLASVAGSISRRRRAPARRRRGAGFSGHLR